MIDNCGKKKKRKEKKKGNRRLSMKRVYNGHGNCGALIFSNFLLCLCTQACRNGTGRRKLARANYGRWMRRINKILFLLLRIEFDILDARKRSIY